MPTYNYDTLLDGGELIQTLDATAKQLCTVPAGKKYCIQSILLAYYGSTETQVTLWIVKNNAGAVGSVADGNIFCPAKKMYPDDNNWISLPLPTSGIPLISENDTIWGKSTAGETNIIISGLTEVGY